MISKDEFIHACKTGIIDIVRQYIAEGGDINAHDNAGNTAMMWAVYYSQTECVRELIKAGADVNIQDKWGRTALMWAAFDGLAECVQELIASGADVNIQDNMGWTALTYAMAIGDKDCINYLLSEGANIADVNMKSSYIRESLQTLLYNKQYDKVQTLIIYGADINAQDENGRPAIDYCKNKRVKAKLIKLANRHIKAAIISSESPNIIKGFDAEM